MLTVLIHWEETYDIYYKGKRKTLLVASKETGLEVNADKIKYRVISRS